MAIAEILVSFMTNWTLFLEPEHLQHQLYFWIVQVNYQINLLLLIVNLLIIIYTNAAMNDAQPEPNPVLVEQESEAASEQQEETEGTNIDGAITMGTLCTDTDVSVSVPVDSREGNSSFSSEKSSGKNAVSTKRGI